MTGNKTKKVEKVFFDLLCKYKYDIPYAPIFGGSKSIDLSELEDISEHSIYVYLTKHYKEFLLKNSNYHRSTNCDIVFQSDHDHITYETLRLQYKYLLDDISTIFIIATNIRLITYDWKQ